MQRSAGNRATSLLVQRYTTINPADYALAEGAGFASQILRNDAHNLGYQRTTRTMEAGIVQDQTDTAAGQGAWTPGVKAPTASALPNLKYGTDGTKAIGIEATAAEPKVFYATDDVVAESNDTLRDTGAEARLGTTGATMTAPTDPANVAAGTLTMSMVKPAKANGGAPPTVVNKFGDAAECNTFIKNVIGEIGARVAVFGPGGGHEARVKEEKEPGQDIANLAVDPLVASGQDLAGRLEGAGMRVNPHDQPLPVAYTGLVGKGARDAHLGINAGAEADVGEGYVIFQADDMPGDVAIDHYLRAIDQRAAGLALTAQEQETLKQKWGYHYAGIVAKVGSDAVSLENYNRGTVANWALDDEYARQIQAVGDLRAHLTHLFNTGRTIPSIPKLRMDWFRQVKKELDDLGVGATVAQQNARAALQGVQTKIAGTEVGASDLYHFKMYGTGGGQSFHEQWEGAVESPMTLRVRQSAQFTRAELRPSLLTDIQDILTRRPSALSQTRLVAASRKLGDLDAATTLPAVRDAASAVRTLVRTAGKVAIESWTDDGLQAMGRRRTAITGLDHAAVADKFDDWATKGWALRSSSKLKLAAKRTALTDAATKIRATIPVSVRA